MSAEWQNLPPRGAAADLPAAKAIASGPSLAPAAVRIELLGSVVVAYKRTRFYLDRRAWEMVADEPGSVLVLQVEGGGKPRQTYALTLSELEGVFGRVTSTRSWEEVRCYHFPSLPPAAAAFRVSPSAGAPSAEVSATVRKSAQAAPRLIVPRRSARGLRRPPDGASVASWVRDINRQLGYEPESPRALQAVDDWRNAWRPSNIRVLLIAESHVTEQPGDDRVAVSSPIPGMPAEYCRLVYCLGYGDANLCQPTQWESQNRGTRQYWELFATLVAGEDRPAPATASAKVATLTRLRDAGIWLVDACVTGVYDPASGGNRLGSAHGQIVRDSYRRFVAPIVREACPEVICIIGRTVQRALAEESELRSALVVPQPNARGLHEEYLAGRARLCAAIAALPRG